MNQIEKIDERAQLHVQREREISGYGPNYQQEEENMAATPVREGLKMLKQKSARNPS